MRAWTFTSQGRPSDVLRLRGDIPRPSATALAPTEVIVKVLYSSAFVGYGALISKIPHLTSNPWIPEMTFAGIIDAASSQVFNVKVGEVVFGGQDFAAHFKHGGTMAEYVVSPADFVVPKPDNVSLQDAAGLAAMGCTVVQFIELSKIKNGDKVLITAASGALGTLLVQSCKSVVGSSGRIVATCSGPNMDMVHKLGADEVIDYTKHPKLHELLVKTYFDEPFDTIFDVAGTNDELYTESPAYLTPTGLFLFGGNLHIVHSGEATIFTMLWWALSRQIRKIRPVILGGTPRRCLFHSARVDKKSLQEVREYAAAGHMIGVIDSEWEMEDLVKAYDRLATGRAKGKVVVQIQDQ